MGHKTGVHACPECSKTFSRLEYVTRHRRLKHLGLRPWSCEVCGASYARSDLLSRHKRKCSATHPAPSKEWPSQPAPGAGIASDNAARPAHTAEPPRYSLYADGVLPGCAKPAASGHVGRLTGQASASGPRSVGLQPPGLEPWATRLLDTPAATAASSSAFSARATSSWQHDTAPAEYEDPVDAFGAQEQPFRSGLADPSTSGAPEARPPFDSSIYQSYPSFEVPLDYCGLRTTLLNPVPHLPGTSQSGSQLGGDDADADEEFEPRDPTLCYTPPTRALVRYSHPAFFITEEPESSPFWLNPQLWVLAFLCQRAQGFTIPHIGMLSRFVRTATEVMMPVIPMIHVPTLSTSRISIHLGYALAVAGAAFESTEAAIAFAEQSLTYKRPLVQKDFACRANAFDFRFELLQTLLTYQFLGIFNRLEGQRKRAVRFGPTMIANFRELGLTRLVRDAPNYVQLVLSGHLPLEIGWQLWVKTEMHKRTVFLMLISSLQTTRDSGLVLADADIRLPCHEDLWTAKTAEAWLQAAVKHGAPSVSDPNRPGPVFGDQAIPVLTDALAALDIGRDHAAAADIQLAVQPDRLGWFATTVLERARNLASQRPYPASAPACDVVQHPTAQDALRMPRQLYNCNTGLGPSNRVI